MPIKKFFPSRADSRTRVILFACLFTLLSVAPAMAGQLDRDTLLGLAREFVTRIGEGFEQANNRPEDVLSPEDKNRPDRIADGSELVLQLVASEKKIPLNFDIIAIKQPYGMDVLLADFFGAADFPIRINRENLTAKGWFIREDQDFFLDLKNNKLVIKGEDHPLKEGDVFVVDGEIFVQSTALEDWFDLNFAYNFGELRVQVFSAQPLPAVSRFIRENREGSRFSRQSDPTLPFEELEYTAFGVPFLDVNLRNSYYKSGEADPQSRASYSVIGAGDFAYLNAKTYISGNDDDPLSTARFTFSRESVDPELLGPLKARRFSFGDISTARMMLSGGSTQEQGVRVTNLPDEHISAFNTTFFRGDAQPEWDAELYRDDRLVDSQEVGNDGIYEFLDVPLFAGANNFRIILYGPQGEIREIEKSIPVTGNSLEKAETYYDVSVSRANEITYQANDIDRPQDGSLHLNARINRGLTDNISGFIGLKSRDEGDMRRNYIETGLNTYLRDTFVDASLAYETGESEAAAEVTARRNFGAHSARARAFIATNGFQPGPLDEDIPLVLDTNFQIDGPAKSFFGLKSDYAVSAGYQRRADDSSNLSASATYTTRFKNVVVNNGLEYNARDSIIAGGGSDEEKDLRYILNARGFFKNGFYRVSGAYDILPDAEFSTVAASYSYPLTNNIDSLVEIEHNIDPSRTELTGSLNWKTEKATISPRFSYSSDDVIQASLNVRFGLGYNPATHDFNMFNQRLSNTGGVSALIFVDKNGNGILDEGEELVEGATLEAVQARRDAVSNEKGIAFIPDLPQGRVTDIRIERASLYDPYFIPSYEGISLRPRPGVVKEIEFPVVVSGEIDGTVYFADKNGAKTPARQFSLHLIAPWGEIIQSTASAYDGFYVFSQIPPGIYYMLVDYEDAKATGYTAPVPKRIVLTPDGTTIYGENILLTPGEAVPYGFDSDIQPPSRKNKTILQHTGESIAGLQVGPFKSRLAAMVAMLKINRISGDVRITSPLDGLTRNEDDKMFWITTDNHSRNVAEIQRSCVALQKFDLPCKVHIYTYAPPAETAILENSLKTG